MKDFDWLNKCRQCKYYYQTQKDADEVKCRLKLCKYKPAEIKKKGVKNEKII